jgi:cytoskeletal protein RodZ
MAKTIASKSTASKATKKAPSTTPAKPASKAAPVKARAATAKKVPASKAAGANTAAAPAVKAQAKARPEAADTKEKSKKAKLVRDSFTMPEAEYAVLGEVKKACLKAGIEVKKSELLRVGVALIRQLDILRLKEILGSLPTLKAGRPKKSK